MVFDPLLISKRIKKKKQHERKIKNKRKVGNFNGKAGTSPPPRVSKNSPGEAFF
jgi:hypothetical protein